MPRSIRRRQNRRPDPIEVVQKIGEFLRGDGVPDLNVAAYLKRLERDYADILPWLPPINSCKAFLDIGCGLGGHAAMLAAYYPKATPNLLDGKENRSKRPDDAGFRPQGEPWVNVYRAARLVFYCDDGRESCAWTYPEVLEPGTMGRVIRGNLTVSFRSLGHLFSVGPYLPLLAHSLAPSGRLILDIRNGTDGLEQLTSSNQLKLLGEIEQQSVKCKRFVLERL